MPGLCACYGAVEIKRIKIKSTKPHRRKEITEWKLSSGPLAIVSEASGVVTVTNWYGIDDDRAAWGNSITCGGLYANGSVSVYDRSPDGTPGTGPRAYYYHVNARWK